MANKVKIMRRLQEHWDFAISKGYAETQLLGIFLYGSQNYGLDDENSDVDSQIIYLPKFDEMCLSKEWKSVELIYKDNEHILIKDLREMRQMWMKQNINFLEIFYTEYFILNPKYQTLWESYFVNNREAICHYDVNKMVDSISGQLINTLKQDPNDGKKLANGYRLYWFLKKYFVEGENFEDSIHLKDEEKLEELRKLKNNTSKLFESEFERRFAASNLIMDTQTLVKDTLILPSPWRDSAVAALNEGVIEILKYSFAPEKEETTKENFLKSLTNAETKAYFAIVKEIGYKGNISISKMTEKYCVSRPVFTSLLIKMKDQKIAKVNNQGVKGTYIEIIQSVLKAEIKEKSIC